MEPMPQDVPTHCDMILDPSRNDDIRHLPLRVNVLEKKMVRLYIGTRQEDGQYYLLEVGFNIAKPLFYYTFDISASVSHVTNYCVG